MNLSSIAIRALVGAFVYALLSLAGVGVGNAYATCQLQQAGERGNDSYMNCNGPDEAWLQVVSMNPQMDPWCPVDRPAKYSRFMLTANKAAVISFNCGSAPTSPDGAWGAGMASYNNDCSPGTTWQDWSHSCTAANQGKSMACPDCKGAVGDRVMVGNPIDTSTGNKFQRELDISEGPLVFERFYNSYGSPTWTNTYSRSVSLSSGMAVVSRPDGRKLTFTQASGQWVSDADIFAKLVQLTDSGGATTGWNYTPRDGREVEQYDALGRLLQITRGDGTTLSLAYNNGVGEGNAHDYLLTSVIGQNGRGLVLTYDASNRLATITDPAGGLFTYGYDTNGNLSSVTYPGGASRGYSYNESAYTGGASLPTSLTGITHEDGVRFATFSYRLDGRAVSTEHAGGVEKYVVTYNPDGSASIANPSGSTESRSFTTLYGVRKATSRVESCSGCTTRSTSYTYDANGYPDVTTDARGVTTDDNYSALGLLTQRIEAANDGTGAKRTIQTDWNASFAVPDERRTYNAAGTLVAKQTWTYNSRGQVLTASRIDPATSAISRTSATYCEQADVDAGTCPLVGLVRSVNGPRTDVTDVTTFTYYASDDASCATAPTTCPHRKGDLWKVTNALGQVTETLAYDGAGRVLSVKDPNGVITDTTYSPRGWLTARKVRGTNNAVETDDAITTIDYWPTGLVKKVTQPDGSYTSYGYDAAHRLTDISDNAEDSIHYTLDNLGNRTGEDTKDPSATLTRTLSRVYNQLGQLQSQRDSALHATTFMYDANGNGDLVTDAASHVTDNDYDPLNRLTRTLQDTAGIAANTQFQYDAVDNLTQVTDPNGLVTGYGYDGLGNLTSLSSPDTGGTSYTYDSAGNRLSQTDARAKVTNYTYDALNRLATTTYGTTSLNVTSTYDAVNAICATGETFALGRLTKLTMGNGNSTQYCYDRFGNLVRKVETINSKVFTLRYGYNLAGRLTSVTYPDGNVVDYVRNALGQATEIGVTPSGGSRQVLLTSATYYPFGPAKQWTFGNGRMMQRTFDLDYRPWSISDTASGGLSLGYTFNAVGNLAELRDSSQTGTPQVTFGYDALNRLTDFLDGPTGATIEHYAYDATGNRTLFQNSSGSQSYGYNTGTHRLNHAGSINRWYDASGNTVSIGGTAQEYTFTSANRMDSAKQGGTVVMNYRYNGKGERVHRFLTTTGTNQTYTVYDEAGHWLGDYDSNATPIQQAIWLDNLPVGVLIGASTSQKLDYVEADALGTPRAVIDPTRNVAIWSWDLKGEAFGSSPPNQDPDLDSTAFVFNLRFPGQQYDSAANLNYNYFRDYDTVTGRYVESDPIGLRGGASTYGYVFGRPFNLFDPKGLQVVVVNPPETSPIPGPGLNGGLAGQNRWGEDDSDDDYRPERSVDRRVDRTAERRGRECESGPNCTKASFWHLNNARPQPIFDEHAYKTQYGAVPNSRYEICACDDGSIVIKAVGQCGRPGPFIETLERWK